MPKQINPRKIDQIVQNSINHLKQEYREINGDCGWHQYLGSDKIGNVANAQALLILQYFDQDFSNKFKVIQTIRKNQFDDSIQQIFKGGWTYVTNFSNEPTVECTSWVLQALKHELDSDDECITNGINWLTENHPSSNADVGFGSIKSDSPKIYATCLALKTLKLLDKDRITVFQRSLAWLKQSQNSDGGWGESSDRDSSVTHTSHAIYTLVRCGVDIKSEIISNGINWLLRNYSKEENWLNHQTGGLVENMDLYHIDNGNRSPQRVTYYHYSLPWALISLCRCEQLNSLQFFNGFSRLIEDNQAGNWIHPFLVAHKYPTMWSKHDALLAFSCLIGTTTNWNDLQSISFKGESIKHRYKKPSRFKKILNTSGDETIYDGVIRKAKNNIVIVIILISVGLYLGISQIIKATKDNKDSLFGKDGLINKDTTEQKVDSTAIDTGNLNSDSTLTKPNKH